MQGSRRVIRPLKSKIDRGIRQPKIRYPHVVVAGSTESECLGSLQIGLSMYSILRKNLQNPPKRPMLVMAQLLIVLVGNRANRNKEEGTQITDHKIRGQP